MLGVGFRPGFALCLVVAVAGCALRQPPAPGSNPGPAHQVTDTDVRDGALHNGFITIRVALPPGARSPVPAVVTLLGQEEVLRASGFAAVSFQVHWELLRGPTPPSPPPDSPTWGKWLLAAPSPHTVGEGYFRLIAGDATETIPQVLDWLAGVPEIDMDRIGIAGVSTKGFTALQAAAADRRIVAAAAIAACGDYRGFLEHSPLGLGGREPFVPTPAYEAFLMEQEPIRHPERLVHAAILMLNGDADHAVPIACARKTARVLAHAYARAGVRRRFRFVVVPGGGHNLGTEAQQQALEWFRRWLVGPRAARARHGSRPRQN
jgi:dienelactone hydrolase